MTRARVAERSLGPGEEVHGSAAAGGAKTEDAGSRKIAFDLVQDSGLERIEVFLQSFLAGEIRGRLVAVGSAKGTGKSSLLNGLMARISEADPAKKAGLKLLMVPVHGPSLFEASGGFLEKVASVPPKEPTPLSMGMMRGLVQALHFAVVRETTARISARTGGAEWAEVLGVDMLRGESDLTRIRAVWDGVGALPEGLFAPGAERGWREITTMWNLGRAYMVTSGVATARRQAAREWSELNKSKVDVTLPWDRVLGPALSLAAGGALGAELFPSSPIGTALVALTSAVAGSWAFSRETTRTETVQRSAEFIEDLDVPALARWMPVLLRQLKDIGLYPVFVVDEVRVAEWAPVGDELLNQLDVCRGFVNLGAFMCLLFDRTSYLTVGLQEPAVRRRLTSTLADSVFLSFDPGRMRARIMADIHAEAVRADALLFCARGRPLSVDDTRLQHLGPEALRVRATYQAAVASVVQASSWLAGSPQDRAFALDLLYAPAERWDAGDRVVDNSAAAMGLWAREMGWLRDSEIDERHVYLRRSWMDRMVKAGLIVESGAFGRWCVSPDGVSQSDWFNTPTDAALWVMEVERTLREFGGLELDVALAWALEASLERQPLVTMEESPMVRANLVAANADRLQTLLLAGLLLAWLGSREGRPTPGQVAVAAERWAEASAPIGREWRDLLGELAQVCPFEPRLLEPWPLASGKWNEAAGRAVARVHGWEGDRPAHLARQATRAERLWLERVSRLACEGVTACLDGRDVGWASLGDELETYGQLPVSGSSVHRWSELAWTQLATLAWVPAAAWSILGFHERVPSPSPERSVPVNQLYERLALRPRVLGEKILIRTSLRGDDTGTGAWRGPTDTQGPRAVASDRPFVWLDTDIEFDEIVWEVDGQSWGWVVTERARVQGRPDQVPRCGEAIVGPQIPVERRDTIERETGLVYVDVRATPTATLTAIKNRRDRQVARTSAPDVGEQL